MASKKDLHTSPQTIFQKWKAVKKSPEMTISLIAIILLVVGVFAAVLLASVEQDIRQQAAGKLYPGDNEGKPTVEVNASKTVCAEDVCTVWSVK